MMDKKRISDNLKVIKKRRITDYFKPRDSPHKCPQTENTQSSAIKLLIDAINNDISKALESALDISDLGKKIWDNAGEESFVEREHLPWGQVIIVSHKYLFTVMNHFSNKILYLFCFLNWHHLFPSFILESSLC